MYILLLVTVIVCVCESVSMNGLNIKSSSHNMFVIIPCFQLSKPGHIMTLLFLFLCLSICQCMVVRLTLSIIELLLCVLCDFKDLYYINETVHCIFQTVFDNG